MLVEFEVAEDCLSLPNSIFHQLSEGTLQTPQPYLSSTLSTQTGSHLFEAILRAVPDAVFTEIWSTYFVGKLGKLCIHPYANFVVAKGIARLDEERLRSACDECKSVSGGRGLISE
jgi:nucleolar protein 9